MFFDIWHLSPNDPRQVPINQFAQCQCLICAFDTGDGIYSYEELISNDKMAMDEARQLDSSAAYQKAFKTYERLIAAHTTKIPRAATLLRIALLRDLGENYPNIEKNGFDIGVVMVPRGKDTKFLNGGVVVYAFFPRKAPGQRTVTKWPFDHAPCLKVIPTSTENSSFWGMIASGVASTQALLGITIHLLVDPEKAAVWQRMREAYTNFLSTAPSAPLFVRTRNKHLFLHHALNILGFWLERKLGGSHKAIAINPEWEITTKSNESTIIRPKPFIQR